MNSLYEILPYSIDVVSSCINDFTDTPISVIKEKPFIKYLDSYLSKWKKINPDSNNCGISFLLEKDYIDYSFLQDFSNYYVKCFNQYRRNCIRIHFFSTDENEINKIHQYGLKKEEFDLLQESYLGFIVIRPIPSTFIARACLKKYDTDFQNHFTISKPIEAHVLGLKFTVQTIPFIEQDKVLSVCATSALWSFFNAHSQLNSHKLPSPYEITTMAINNDDSKYCGLLNNGLTVQMICNCIKNNNLVPLSYEFNEENPSYFYQLIHVFVSSGYPVIIGLSVYNEKPDKNDPSKNNEGLHAVVAMGDELTLDKEPKFKETAEGIRLLSDYLSKLYIHDDRIGPYARLEYSDNSWTLNYLNSETLEQKKEYYVPSEIVIGVYQKIRLPFPTVFNFSIHLTYSLIKAIKTRNGDNTLKSMISSLCWDYKFEEGSKLKERIRFAKELDNSEKEKILSLSLPLYCWVAKGFFGDDKEIGFEIIIDATNISQGNYIISVLFYNDVVENIFNILKNYFSETIETYGGTGFNELVQQSLWALYKWFYPSIDVYSKLDYLFGESKIPKYIKKDEIKSGAIKDQKPIVISCQEDVKNISFDKKKKYIWVIDKDGSLLIGTEDKIDNSDNKGHPTLLQGRPGRIAGEMFFCNGKWKINGKSGRYSNPVEYSEEDKEKYVKNAIKERFKLYFPALDFFYEPKQR